MMNNRRNFLQNVGLGFIGLIGAGLTKTISAEEPKKPGAIQINAKDNYPDDCYTDYGKYGPMGTGLIDGHSSSCKCGGGPSGCAGPKCTYDMICTYDIVWGPVTCGTFNNSASVTLSTENGPVTYPVTKMVIEKSGSMSPNTYN